MSDVITYDEFLKRLRDPTVDDDALVPYVQLLPGEGGLDFTIKPNPDTVRMTAADQELENALSIGNGMARLRRRLKFFDISEHFPDRPVLVSEGDSWLQFPILIKEVIDQLLPDYNIWSLGAAGATLHDMIHGPPGKGGFEFLAELRRHQARVKAFIFSGAGNDIIGDDPATGLPMLEGLLNNFNGDEGDVAGHINASELNARIAQLSSGYTRIVQLVRAEPGFEDLPIVFHGYDYAFPYPASNNDPRNPRYAKKDQWLGRAFAARAIESPDLRRKIVMALIDRLYTMLFALRDMPGQHDVHVVDCRGAMPRVEDWNDEIHGTSDGFVEVGNRFRTVLQGAIAGDGGP